MGRILSIQGETETILDPVEDLDYLMGRIRTSGMMDKDELLRELKNIYWDMGY